MDGIVGSGIPTAGQFCDNCLTWPDGSTDGTQTLIPAHLVRIVNGDTNVPVFSGTQGDPLHPNPVMDHYYFTCGVAHAALFQDQDVIDQTVPYLLGDQSTLTYGSTFATQPCPLGSLEPSISASPTYGTAGVPVSFDASATTDSQSITSYSWDFGDGTTGTGVTATHVYSSVGSHTVTLTVTDAARNTATRTVGINVAAGVDSTAQDAQIVGAAGAPTSNGYWLASRNGGVFTYGDAPFYGSMGGVHLNAPIVGMAADPATGGYWLVGADGGAFSFHAPFYGSMGGVHLNAPVTGIVADPATGGYWLGAADGGVFSFNAPFFGSIGGVHLNAPVTGIAADPATGGYWLGAADGGVFSFNAIFQGSASGTQNAPFVAMATQWTGDGYWLVTSNGQGSGLFTNSATSASASGGLAETAGN